MFYLKDIPIKELQMIGFKAGIYSPWIGAIIGILDGILIGFVAEYYTNEKYKPTRELSEFSKGGPAIIITKGLALGMQSVLVPVFC